MELIVSENEAQIPLSDEPESESNSFQTTILRCLPAITYVFLTVNAVDSAYRSRNDPPALAFVGFAYLDLTLLLFCLKQFEKLGAEGSPEKKGELKAAIWFLATALNFAFACRVADVMPRALAVVVWMMSASVAAGGFYGLFIYRDVDADLNLVGHAYSGVKSPEGEV